MVVKKTKKIAKEPCADHGGQALYDQLALLDGTWIMDSIKYDDGPLIQSWVSKEMTLFFEMDFQGCENSFFSVSGGEYLIDDATRESLSFVEGSGFLRMNLGRHLVLIESISETHMVLLTEYEELEDDRSVGWSWHVIYFSKQE